MANDQTPLSGETPQKPTTGTQNIVHEHLKDPNHVISDEDIRNVEVGKSDEVPATGAELQARFADRINEDLPESEQRDIKGENDKGDDADFTPPNPWNVLK